MPPGALLRWASALYLVLAIVGVLWLGSRLGRIDLSLFVRRESWWLDAALGLGAAALLVGLWQLGLAVIPMARTLEQSIAKTLGPLGASEVVALALLSGFAEEVFFRGAIQSALGVVVATGLFGLLHMGPGREYRLWTIFALLAGGVLGGLMEWRQALLAPVLAHITVNLVGLMRLRRLHALGTCEQPGELLD